MGRSVRMWPTTAIAALTVLGAMVVPAAGAVPPIMNFQGRLLQSDGSVEAGILNVGFALYDTETGGAPIWSETQTVAFSDGFYSVMLGSITPIPVSTLDDPRYLGVTVSGTELLPRMRVASAAFALRAGVAASLVASATGSGSGLDSDSVDGLDATDLALAGHTHPPGDANTLDGIDSTGFAGVVHTHSPADADTLDGIDSTGFAGVAHTHGATDFSGPQVTISASTYTGTSFRSALAADATGVSICGAGFHVCYGWEMRIHSVMNNNLVGFGTTRAWASSHHTWSDTGNWDHSYGNDGNGGCTPGSQMIFQYYELSRYNNHTWCDADTTVHNTWCCENL